MHREGWEVPHTNGEFREMIITCTFDASEMKYPDQYRISVDYRRWCPRYSESLAIAPHRHETSASPQIPRPLLSPSLNLYLSTDYREVDELEYSPARSTPSIQLRSRTRQHSPVDIRGCGSVSTATFLLHRAPTRLGSARFLPRHP